MAARMIYRTYSNGVRLTCEASSSGEARRRFARMRRDFARAIKAGCASGPQALGGCTLRFAYTLRQMNHKDGMVRRPKRRKRT